MIDLHLHTLASDGAHTPEEIIELVKKERLYAFAIADHNSIDSLPEGWRLAQENQLNFFPAVEFDTLYKDYDLHLLAYGIDFTHPDCLAWMEEILQAKIEQTRKRVERLKELGFKTSSCSSNTTLGIYHYTFRVYPSFFNSRSKPQDDSCRITTRISDKFAFLYFLPV